MVDPNQSKVNDPMSVGAGILHWMACLFLVVIVFVIFGQGENPLPALILAAITYVICGFYLNRNILPRLIEYHPVYDTLENVTQHKLAMFKFWPVKYPKLFIQLLIKKNL